MEGGTMSHETTIQVKDIDFSVLYERIPGMKGDGYITPDDSDELQVKEIWLENQPVDNILSREVKEQIREKLYEQELI